MIRKLTLTLSLALSLMVAKQAAAVTITAVDLGGITLGPLVGSAVVDDFTDLVAPPAAVGELVTRVYFDGVTYIYTQTVTPNGNFNFIFNTEFDPAGFTDVAGWRFSDAAVAGATGGMLDFRIEHLASGELVWIAIPDGAFGEWNAFEPITFFFASTNPPAIGDYRLFRLQPISLGTAQGLAPEAAVPEPTSLTLLGLGLAGMAGRRWRQRKRA